MIGGISADLAFSGDGVEGGVSAGQASEYSSVSQLARSTEVIVTRAWEAGSIGEVGSDDASCALEFRVVDEAAFIASGGERVTAS